MSSTLKTKGTKALAWDVFGKFANSGMGFFITLFLARLLEPSEFGTIAIVLVLLGIFNIFSDGGLASALIQRKKLLSIHYSSVYYFNLALALIIALSIYFMSDWISDFYDNPQLSLVIKVMSVAAILSGFSSVQIVQLKKSLNYSRLTKISIVSSVVSGVVGILLALNGAGIWSLVTQNLLFGLVSNILLWHASNWRPSLEFSFKALRKLWVFGFNVFVVNLLNAIFARIDMLVIGKLYSQSILGYFDRAKHLNQMILSYSAGSIQSVLFPVLSKIQKNIELMQNTVTKIYAILSFVIFLLIGLFYLTADELIVVLFSAKWIPTVVYFKIIVLSIFASVYSSLMVSTIIARGKSKLYLRMDVYKKIMFAINLYIGFKYGIAQYMYGFVLVSILAFLVDLYFSCREVSLSMLVLLRITVIQLLIGCFSVYILMVLSKNVFYNPILLLLFKGSLFTVLYCSLSWLFKTRAWAAFYEESIVIKNKIIKGK